MCVDDLVVMMSALHAERRGFTTNPAPRIFLRVWQNDGLSGRVFDSATEHYF